jgi:hypothetical protein
VQSDFHLELVRLLSFVDVHQAISYGVDRVFIHKISGVLKDHVANIYNALRRRKCDLIQEMFRDGTVADNWPPEDFLGYDFRFFEIPENWLFGTSDNRGKQLNLLSSDSKSNKKIAKACARISYELFARPLQDEEYAVRHAAGLEEIREILENHAEYVRSLWEASMNLDSSDELLRDLVSCMNDAKRIQHVSIGILNNCFPQSDQTSQTKTMSV